MNPATSTAINLATPAAPDPVTATSLIDDIMGVLMRGERSLFDELACTVWDPAATLAALAGSGRDRDARPARNAS